MIDLKNYTDEEIDLIYSTIEEAVETNNRIDAMKIFSKIKTKDLHVIFNDAHEEKDGNDFIYSVSIGAVYYYFEGLKWTKDNEIYYCLIEFHTLGKSSGNSFKAAFYPKIVKENMKTEVENKVSIIKKENRFYK